LVYPFCAHHGVVHIARNQNTHGYKEQYARRALSHPIAPHHLVKLDHLPKYSNKLFALNPLSSSNITSFISSVLDKSSVSKNPAAVIERSSRMKGLNWTGKRRRATLLWIKSYPQH
jgi:hypothetical protein